MKYQNKNWPKEPTSFDIERMEKAEAKRERKANNRLAMGGSLSGERGVKPDDLCVQSHAR